jgi:spore germination protein
MRHMKRIALLIMMSSILLTAGCSPFVDNNTIEEIAPVVFWSINDGGKGMMKISTLVPPLINEKKRLLTLQVDMLKQAGKGFNLIYYRELKSAQIRLVLIDEQLARKEVLSLINTLIIDPEISSRLYLVIVKGNFIDYINSQLLKQENLDYFIYRMFRHYETKNQGEMTVINLHQFMTMLYSPFPSPIMPVFKVNHENFTYEGSAFFGHDQLIATVRGIDDQIFQLLNHDHYLKLFSIPALNVTIGKVRSKVHMKLSPDRSSIYIQVDLDGRIEEYRGEKNVLDRNELASLDKELEAYLGNQTKALLKKMQQWKVDPLQLGNLTLKPFSKPISEKDWLNDWERMNINVDYRLHILPLTNVKE